MTNSHCIDGCSLLEEKDIALLLFLYALCQMIIITQEKLGKEGDLLSSLTPKTEFPIEACIQDTAPGRVQTRTLGGSQVAPFGDLFSR